MTPTPVQQNLPLTGIDRAVFAAGSQAALATLLKSRSEGKDSISQQAVSQFVKQGYVPLERAKEVSAATGVPVADLVSPKVRELLNN